uniref:ATP synthase complex subunit 8 n=1 Tax=Neopetrolisthes maculatus TaxID=941218 RepID=L0E8R5_9EUCA|nr:ATP synthase F0 subunit 8 [Neopetrolisthes maculatus]AGA56146.1 ATP synthase F0 subunit 8 [Neopetrolisthes maculatus]
MPQMAPILWLNLMLVFTLTLFFFIVVNYFFKGSSKIEKLPQNFFYKEKSWKW